MLTPQAPTESAKVGIADKRSDRFDWPAGPDAHKAYQVNKARVVAGLRKYNPDAGGFQVLLREGDVVTIRGGTIEEHLQNERRRVHVTVERTGRKLTYWTRMLQPLETTSAG